MANNRRVIAIRIFTATSVSATNKGRGKIISATMATTEKARTMSLIPFLGDRNDKLIEVNSLQKGSRSPLYLSEL